MKELLKYASGAAIGIVVTLVILSFIRGCINYEINIIDALMLIITTALTIAVVYLGNSLHYCPVKAGKSVFEIVET